VAGDVVTGVETAVIGENERVNYLSEQYTTFVDDKLLSAAEKCCAGGMVVLRPFVVENEIHVTLSEIDNFDVFATNEKREITGIVFRESLVMNEKYYTLYEKCEYKIHVVDESATGVYSIEYHATVADAPGGEEKEVPLSTVDKWADYQNVLIKDVSRPWFVVLNMPMENIFERNSVYGIPIFAKGMEHIVEADKHDARTKREVRVTEIKLDVETSMLNTVQDKNAAGGFRYELPEGEEGLYRSWKGDPQFSKFGIQVFNPEPRIESYHRRMEHIKRNIEYSCGVSYGMLSEAQITDKTAEEVRASKRRYYRLVQRIQGKCQTALEQLVVVFDEMTSFYGFAPDGTYEMQFAWDDSVMSDRPNEFKERLALLASNVITGEEMYRWYFDISDDEEVRGMPAPFEEG
jgi:A118 family predicted phage portal protein